MNNPEFWNPKRLIRVLKSDWWHKNLTLDEILIWVPIGTHVKFESRRPDRYPKRPDRYSKRPDRYPRRPDRYPCEI